MMAPSRAERPMAPRMASGVPAATPQAPATMMTAMVEETLPPEMKYSITAKISAT